MSDVRLVVVNSEELQRLIVDAVRAATAQRAKADEWVDAKSSGLGRRMFLRLAREGAFPASKRGRAYVARRADVDAYLESQRLVPTRNIETSPGQPMTPAVDPIAEALALGRLRIVKKSP